MYKTGSPSRNSQRRARDPQVIAREQERARQRANEWRTVPGNKERQLRTVRRCYGALRTEMLTAYGMVCACCGETRPKFLTLEHPKKDGASHRRKVSGNLATMWRAMRKLGWPKEYTLLCWNCNCARGFYGTCAHEDEAS